MGDADEALDLVQETFVSAHQALARYDGARSMKAWLSAIALNGYGGDKAGHRSAGGVLSVAE